eukprot:g4118.t1
MGSHMLTTALLAMVALLQPCESSMIGGLSSQSITDEVLGDTSWLCRACQSAITALHENVQLVVNSRGTKGVPEFFFGNCDHFSSDPEEVQQCRSIKLKIITQHWDTAIERRIRRLKEEKSRIQDNGLQNIFHTNPFDFDASMCREYCEEGPCLAALQMCDQENPFDFKCSQQECSKEDARCRACFWLYRHIPPYQGECRYPLVELSPTSMMAGAATVGGQGSPSSITGNAISESRLPLVTRIVPFALLHETLSHVTVDQFSPPAIPLSILRKSHSKEATIRMCSKIASDYSVNPASMSFLLAPEINPMTVCQCLGDWCPFRPKTKQEMQKKGCGTAWPHLDTSLENRRVREMSTPSKSLQRYEKLFNQ